MTQDKAIHTNIRFEDLSFEKQEAVIASLVTRLQELAQKEGEEFLTRNWNNPKPQTWQEAYCRIYAVEHELWAEYEAGKDSRDPDFVWETRQEEHVRQVAHEKAKQSLIKTEVEITL